MRSLKEEVFKRKREEEAEGLVTDFCFFGRSPQYVDVRRRVFYCVKIAV